MRIHFNTNLDLARGYVWAQTSSHERSWDHIPREGERIRFSLPIEPKGSYFELQVCGVSYSADGQECYIDLHIPYMGQLTPTFPEWEDNLKRRLGRL